MHSNDGNSSPCRKEDADHSKDLDEVESIAIETSKYSSLRKIEDSLSGIKEFSTTATQTPLTLIKLTLTQASLDKQFIDSTTSSACFNRNTKQEEKDLFSMVRSKTSLTLSREVMTQATPPHPLVTHSIPSRDSLQESTSLFSSKSGPRNEVLTVTTDYGSSSPDARSILVDTINQIGNRSPRLSVRDTLDLAPVNRETVEHNASARRTNRRWRLNCLRSAVNDEVLSMM